jgi:hypothetical protein
MHNKFRERRRPAVEAPRPPPICGSANYTTGASHRPPGASFDSRTLRRCLQRFSLLGNPRSGRPLHSGWSNTTP